MIPVLAFITGFLVKLVDLIEDEELKLPKHLGSVLGVAYGVLIGYVISLSASVANVWIGAVAGNAIMGKIDAKSHYFAFAAIVAAVAFLGLPALNPVALVLLTIAAILDETSDEFVDSRKLKSRIGEKILSKRPFLEVAALAFSASIGDWTPFLSIFAFDVAYVLTRKVLGRHKE